MTPDELDSLWDFDDPDGSERRFRALLPRAHAEQGGALLAELLTQIARAEGLQGRFDDADRTLDDAEAALLPGDERGRVRLLLERGRVANTARHEGRGSSLFFDAWERAPGGRQPPRVPVGPRLRHRRLHRSATEVLPYRSRRAGDREQHLRVRRPAAHAELRTTQRRPRRHHQRTHLGRPPLPEHHGREPPGSRQGRGTRRRALFPRGTGNG